MEYIQSKVNHKHEQYNGEDLKPICLNITNISAYLIQTLQKMQNKGAILIHTDSLAAFKLI